MVVLKNGTQVASMELLEQDPVIKTSTVMKNAEVSIVVYGLTRDLNAQRLAKGQLGLPITIAQQNTMGIIHYLKYHNTITGLASLTGLASPLYMRRWYSPKVTNTTLPLALRLQRPKRLAFLIYCPPVLKKLKKTIRGAPPL